MWLYGLAPVQIGLESRHRGASRDTRGVMKVVPCALAVALLAASVIQHPEPQASEQHTSSDELNPVGESVEATGSGSDKKVRFSLSDEQETTEPHIGRRNSRERFIKPSTVEHANKDAPQVQDDVLADLLETENLISILSFTALILLLIAIFFGDY